MQGSNSKDFTNSKAWQEGHRLVLTAYRFLRVFPSEEQFSLKEQMKRSAVAVTTNIAEGLSVSDSGERLKFFTEANASLVEFQNCLLISRDVGYLKTPYFDEIARQMVMVNKQLAALLKAVNGK